MPQQLGREEFIFIDKFKTASQGPQKMSRPGKLVVVVGVKHYPPVSKMTAPLFGVGGEG